MLKTLNRKTGGALWLFAFALVVGAWWQISLAQTAEQPAPAEQTESETQDDDLAAEDAAVQEVLKDAELIYSDDDDGDFIPTEAVSADQSIDYPVDI